MCSAPRITVAVPTSQGDRHVGETIRSILAQTVPFELVVSDDRSEDETVAAVERLAGTHARIVVNSTRLGLARNWNQCVELSGTPFVAIVHQDDVLLPDHLARHLAMLETDDRLGMIVSGALPIDDQGQPLDGGPIEPGWIGSEDRLYSPGEFVRELVARNPVRCTAVVLRKAAIEAVGGFDPGWRYAVDWEFWIRLARSWGVGWIAEGTTMFRWHAASETHRFRRGLVDLMEQERLLESIRRREGPLIADFSDLHARAVRRLARGYLARAYDALTSGRPALARRAARRARALWPGIAGDLARHPRLAAAVVGLELVPRPAARCVRRLRDRAAPIRGPARP